MAVADNPLQKKLDSAISDLIGGAKKHSASTDKSWQLTTNKEVFHESFRKSWEYLYLPLGAMFAVPKSDYGIPPGAPSATGRFSAPLSLMFTDNDGTEFILDKDYATADFQNIKRDFVSSTEPWKLFFLSELLSELLWLIKMSVPNNLVYLAGFKAQGALSNSTSLPIGLDVFSIWAFDTRNPKLVGLSEISFDSCTENIGLRWGILDDPSNEYGGKEFATKSSESPNGNKIKSVVCHREFLDNNDCCGVLLFGRDSSTESVTVHWNGVELDATCASCNSDFRQKSLYPLAEVMKDKVSVQHPFSAFIMFGASPDLEGVYGQTLGSSDTVGLPISVAGTFIEVGLHCTLDQALAISRSIHAGIRSLQAELFAYMAKVNIERLNEERDRLAVTHDIFETVRSPITRINEAIANLQSEVQFVNLHLAPGLDGLFSAYSLIERLFRDDGELQIMGHDMPISICHFGTYHERDDDLTWVLSYTIHHFLGLDPTEEIKTEKTSTSQSSAISHINRALEALEKGLKLNLQLAKSLMRLMHENHSHSDELRQGFLCELKKPDSNAARRLAMRNVKERYHTVLKARQATEIKLKEVAPYTSLVLAEDLRSTNYAWKNHGFSSHAPLLRFLDGFVQSKDSRSKDCEHRYEVSQSAEYNVHFTMKKNFTDQRAAETVTIFDEDVDFLGIANALKEQKDRLTKGGGGSDLTGYGLGNTVLPIQTLVRSALTTGTPEITATAENITLKFKCKLQISIGKLNGDPQASTITFLSLE